MNAMIRVLKGLLAVLALAAVGLLLRWMTAGSLSGLRTYDLDSLTVAAVGTIAWIAYAWLTLAVLLTVLEQIPGVIGALAGAVAARITTRTARALLRSGLGVAAITPLTVSAAHATPNTPHVRQAPEPSSTVQLAPRNPAADGHTFRATEPPSTVRITSPGTASQEATTRDFRATEPASTVQLGGPASAPQADPNVTARTDRNSPARQEPATSRKSFRATEPASTVQIGRSEAAPEQATGGRGAFRATEPTSTVKLGGTAPGPSGETAGSDRPATERPQVDVPDQPAGERARTSAPDQPADERASTDVPEQPADRRARTDVPERPDGRRGPVGVPDRPTDGAPTRYTELRPAVPVRVVVRDGDSLWSIAARELGPAATNEAIAARWPDWYAANRQVIGGDPDLIVPGQVLRIPPAPNGDHLPPLHQEP